MAGGGTHDPGGLDEVIASVQRGASVLAAELRELRERLAAEVQAEVAAAFQAAKEAPWPDPATATDHVYSGRC